MSRSPSAPAPTVVALLGVHPVGHEVAVGLAVAALRERAIEVAVIRLLRHGLVRVHRSCRGFVALLAACFDEAIAAAVDDAILPALLVVAVVHRSVVTLLDGWIHVAVSATVRLAVLAAVAMA